VLALDPRELPPHPHRIGADPVYHLEPVDFVGQFPALPGGDDQARELVELFAKACVNGVLSPDQDWRRRWQESLDATVDHYVRGVH
jgi:hypothetical protein